MSSKRKLVFQEGRGDTGAWWSRVRLVWVELVQGEVEEDRSWAVQAGG